MKTKQIIVPVLIAGLTLTGASVYAAWHGWGQQKWHDHSPAEMIEDIAKTDLSQEESDKLVYQYAEEMLARDLYTHFYELYGTQTFQNIAASEAHHMDAVKALLDRYDLDAPSNYGELEDEYDALKAEGEESEQAALEVGLKIEMLDIEDIVETIEMTDNDDIKFIFTNIWGASYNHLRGFSKALINGWYETGIDISDYLSDEQIDTKGSLKHLLAERLEDDWIELPEEASSEAIKERCANENRGKWHGQGNGKMQWKNKWQWYGYGKWGEMKGKGQNNGLRQKYRVSLEEKYQNKIEGMSTSKLETVVERIDALLEKVQNGNYSNITKQNYGAMLWALRDMIMEQLWEEELNLDSLFE